MDVLDLLKLSAAVVLSAAMVAVLLQAMKRLDRSWPLLLLALLPIVAIYIFSPNQRVLGSHGFMHLSFVYAQMNGTFPSDNPLVAGEALTYPWAHHLLIARLSSLLQTAPSVLFALLNTVALAATLIFIVRVSRHLFTDRTAYVFAAFLAIYATTFVELNKRAIPVVEKFTNYNSMPLGTACFALFLYCASQLTSAEAVPRRIYALLCLSILGAGLFYPLTFLALIACTFSLSALLFVRNPKFHRQRAVAFLLCVAGSTALLIPYLIQTVGGRSGEAAMGISSVGGIAYKFLEYTLTLLPLGAVVYWQRSALKAARPDILYALLTAGATTTLMFILLHAPEENEYKYLSLTCIPFGVIAGAPLMRVLAVHPKMAFLIMTLFLIPTSSDVLTKMHSKWRNGIANPYVEEGITLHHADPQEEALYDWIRTRTDSKALFIDSLLTIPPFGQRSLYVALKRPRTPGVPDGWGPGIGQLLRDTCGCPMSTINHRIAVAESIFATQLTLSDNVTRELMQFAKTRPLYIVARDHSTETKLSKSELFTQAFATPKATIFEVMSRAGKTGDL